MIQSAFALLALGVGILLLLKIGADLFGLPEEERNFKPSLIFFLGFIALWMIYSGASLVGS